MVYIIIYANKTEINLECIKDYINNKYRLKCNELKVKFLVSENKKYEAFQISLYHKDTKVLYITSLCRIEICIKSDDKRHDRLYRNEYLQNKECQNTIELLKNEIKEYWIGEADGSHIKNQSDFYNSQPDDVN